MPIENAIRQLNRVIPALFHTKYNESLVIWNRLVNLFSGGQLTESKRFVYEIEQKIERRIEFRGQGRPRNAVK